MIEADDELELDSLERARYEYGCHHQIRDNLTVQFDTIPTKKTPPGQRDRCLARVTWVWRWRGATETRWWLALLLMISVTTGGAAEPVLLSVFTAEAGREIPTEAVGLSYETSCLLPNKNGDHYFRPDNQPLVTVFQALGIKSLRIGGNSVDAPNIPLPKLPDVQALFEFARVAGVKVIYSVRLQNGEPSTAAEVAKLLHDDYSDWLDSFAIGNEPYYCKQYSDYTNRWTAIRDAILAVYPEARFCGPDQNPSPELTGAMARDFGSSAGRLVQLTQHHYPFGCAYQNYRQIDITKLDSIEAATNQHGGPLLVPYDARAARAKMLAATAYEGYEAVRRDLTEIIAGSTLTYRLTEVNSFWFSGLKGASDSFAAALWGLDYLNWWMAQGAAGVNFHTGDRTGGAVSMPCQYAVFVSVPGGYEVRPLGYGLKLFSLASTGRVVPVRFPTSPPATLVGYATLANDKTLSVILINKAHNAAAEELMLRIELDALVATQRARGLFLTSQNGDIAARAADVRLGGERIKVDGTWTGRWTDLARVSSNAIEVNLPPAAAVLIQIPLR